MKPAWARSSGRSLRGVVLVAILALLGLVAVGLTGILTWQGPLPALRSVPDPDLSRLDGATRRLLVSRREALEKMRARHGAPRAELAEAFGETARYYMAARLFEPAESCFVNARALAPREFRWVYLLGHLYRIVGRTEAAVEAFETARRLRPADPRVSFWLDRLPSSGRDPHGGERSPAVDGPADASPDDPQLEELDRLLPPRPGASEPD